MAPYFKNIEREVTQHFNYVVNDDRILGLPELENNFGLHLHIGATESLSIKTDILNWAVADFIYPAMEMEGIS